MTLKEAIAAGKPFKRAGDENFYYFGNLVLTNEDTGVTYLKSVADSFETDFEEPVSTTAMIPLMTPIEFDAMTRDCGITGTQASDLRAYFDSLGWLSR